MTDAEVLDQLVALQKVDSGIQELEELNSEAKQKIEELNSKIAQNKAEFASKKQRLDSFRKKRAEIEVDIKSKEGEIKKKDEQTSQVSTNEAYKALQTEIDSLKADIKKNEDEILSIMEEEEGVYSWIKEQEVIMKKEEESINEEIKKLNDEIKVRENEAAERKKARDEQASKISKNWYERYERIRINKGGLALAPVLSDKKGNGQCGGCKMSVRAQAVIEVKKKNAIHTCENCARIWYFEEG